MTCPLLLSVPFLALSWPLKTDQHIKLALSFAQHLKARSVVFIGENLCPYDFIEEKSILSSFVDSEDIIQINFFSSNLTLTNELLYVVDTGNLQNYTLPETNNEKRMWLVKIGANALY